MLEINNTGNNNIASGENTIVVNIAQIELEVLQKSVTHILVKLESSEELIKTIIEQLEKLNQNKNYEKNHLPADNCRSVEL